ncbi:protocatechuate 3,4-dioxygenase, partial [Klebsiella pneumoniae]
NNPDWDAQFVDMLVNDPEKLTEMTLGEYAELGGWRGPK